MFRKIINMFKHKDIYIADQIDEQYTKRPFLKQIEPVIKDFYDKIALQTSFAQGMLPKARAVSPAEKDYSHKALQEIHDTSYKLVKMINDFKVKELQ